MAVISIDQIVISAIKIFESALYLYAMIKVIRVRKYIVNQLFAVGFLGWALFLLLDVFSNTIGGISSNLFEVAKIIWGIQVILSVVNSYLFFLAVRIIVVGETEIQKKRIFTEIAFITIVAILSSLNITLNIVFTGTPYNSEFEMNEIYTPIGLILVVVPFLVYFIAIYYLTKVLKRVNDADKKKHMRYMLFGLLFIPMGYLYFIIMTVLFTNLVLVVRIVGHIFWILAPSFLYASQRQTVKKE